MIAPWLRGYQRSWLTADAVAGVVAACVVIPQAIAYAGLLFTWLLVAVRTARGSLRGNLLKVPPSSAPIKARKQRVN